jgi:hypothetical protein
MTHSLKHSPAPWSYRISANCPDVWEVQADFCESPIAEIPRWLDEDGMESPEAEANAELIAAAPEVAAERNRLKAVNAELIEALDYFYNISHDLQSSLRKGYFQQAQTKARAAIAKAEGK